MAVLSCLFDVQRRGEVAELCEPGHVASVGRHRSAATGVENRVVPVQRERSGCLVANLASGVADVNADHA